MKTESYSYTHVAVEYIFNSNIELEAIPDILKRGSITPVCQGGGKDPLDKNNYTGVSLLHLF